MSLKSYVQRYFKNFILRYNINEIQDVKNTFHFAPSLKPAQNSNQFHDKCSRLKYLKTSIGRYFDDLPCVNISVLYRWDQRIYASTGYMLITKKAPTVIGMPMSGGVVVP